MKEDFSWAKFWPVFLKVNSGDVVVVCRRFRRKQYHYYLVFDLIYSPPTMSQLEIQGECSEAIEEIKQEGATNW